MLHCNAPRRKARALTGRFAQFVGLVIISLASACADDDEAVRAITGSRVVLPAAPGDAHVHQASDGPALAFPGSPMTAGPMTAGGVSPPPAGLSAGLRWTTPEGWRRAPDRPMRVVTLLPSEDPAVECYVTVLSGHAGGSRANLERWYGQMGAAVLTDATYAALPRLHVLGVEAVMSEIHGRFTDMQGDSTDDALMLGTVCMLPDRAVFVKLVGPRSAVELQREAFAAFCASLELGPGA